MDIYDKNLGASRHKPFGKIYQRRVTKRAIVLCNRRIEDLRDMDLAGYAFESDRISICTWIIIVLPKRVILTYPRHFVLEEASSI
ncbi:hypothetical protein H5410_056579 [Solanum commersonii]|uniref:Uncharacterized protein n=1 Tax=Solanum commersonii TaxID=4109 RepID=A0A9J5WM46_SOLCO|nr:hypothetical protein H5410_056579 [Solanum commersonii]